MSGDLDLEQRYRRVLRLLPGCRERWPGRPRQSAEPEPASSYSGR